MKRNLGLMTVLFFIMVGFVLLPAAQAQVTDVVEGIVYEINLDENSIQVDEGDSVITTVYCVPFNFLAKRGLVLDVGTVVSIGVYERTFSDGTVKLIAVSITVDGKTCDLPGRNPNRL